MHEAQIDLSELQAAVLAALPMIRDEISELFAGAADDTPGIGTLTRLVAYQSQRGQAALHLATVGMPWDAEIVMRAFYEATARILFLSLSDAEERSQLEAEYWNVLGAIGERKRALKVEARGPDFPTLDPRGTAIMDVFRDPSLFAVQPTGTKSSRKAVEQKWSFSEIISWLAERKRSDIAGLRELIAYLHPYGVSSHLLHADAAALDLMEDRATRPPEEEPLLAATQICRIFTDIVGLFYFAADALRVMLGREFVESAALRARVWRCIELSQPLLDAFYNTQADLYRRHGRSEFGLAPNANGSA